MWASVKPQDPKACAVIERGVLKRPAIGDFHKLDVDDLDRFPGLSLFEELHLARHSLSCPPQARQADVPKDPLDRAHGHPNIVNAPQPELRALGAGTRARGAPGRSVQPPAA